MPLSSRESATKTDETLDKFEKHCGLGEFKLHQMVENEAQRLLNLGPEELKRLSATECSEGAFILESFSIHLQRAINREKARATWSDARITRLISSFVHEMPAYTPSERRNMAIRSNDAAKETEAIRVSAQVKCERLEYLPARVSSLAKYLDNISHAKRVRQ